MSQSRTDGNRAHAIDVSAVKGKEVKTREQHQADLENAIKVVQLADVHLEDLYAQV